MDNYLRESEELLKRLERVNKFESNYKIFPHQEADNILLGMRVLVESLPEIENPKNQNELIISEMKRKFIGETLLLEQRLVPRAYDFDTMMNIYAIPQEDLQALHPWLVSHKKQTADALDRLYHSKDFESHDLGLQSDVPNIRRQAEEFGALHIQKYHQKLGKHLEELTKVGAFLRDINAVPTTEARSYFNPLTQTLAIGIPAICFSNENGNLQIRERDLIRLYGHEGMGHALNKMITSNSQLPYFLTRDSPLGTASAEAVAQFYERVIFEDLKNSPKTQKALGIHHYFDEIYQDAQDTALLDEYRLKLFQYAIIVLADKNLGYPEDPETLKRKMDLISEVTLDPTYPFYFVENNRRSFDSGGNLNPQLIGELRYCAQPVKRSLEEFSKIGIEYTGDERSKIDMTLLTGFWTPIGFVQNTKIKVNSI